MNKIKTIDKNIADLQKQILALEAEKKSLLKQDKNKEFDKYYEFYSKCTPSVTFLAETDGKGYYTKKKIKNLKCFFGFNKEDLKEYNQVNVFFDTNVWNYDEYNIIYTDDTFEKCVKKKLKELGFKNWNKIGYSEAGMQPNNAAHFDMDRSLAKEIYLKIVKNNPHYSDSDCEAEYEPHET